MDCVDNGFLTKYSAIFAEVKGYFGIDERDNELELLIVDDCFLRILDQVIFNNQLEVSNQSQNNNQLECLKSSWSK